eukprot:SAG31_NODE_1770_length_7309_cov_56.975867_4_plen_156_part_00
MRVLCAVVALQHEYLMAGNLPNGSGCRRKQRSCRFYRPKSPNGTKVRTDRFLALGIASNFVCDVHSTGPSASQPDQACLDDDNTLANYSPEPAASQRFAPPFEDSRCLVLLARLLPRCVLLSGFGNLMVVCIQACRTIAKQFGNSSWVIKTEARE